jgi:hypothetical protein
VPQLLARAAKDSDPVSCFPNGTCWEDAESAILVVKGGREARAVHALLAAHGYLSHGKAVLDDTSTLWAVDIGGAMVPAPSKEEAEAACLLLNASFSRMPPQGVDPMRAAVTQWTGTPLAHAAERHEFRNLLETELQVAW